MPLRTYFKLCFLLFPLSSMLFAQNEKLAKNLDNVVVITGPRRNQELFKSPATQHVFEKSEITNERQSRTIPDVLSETTSVMVQKTSYGQGSPFIRGFTGYHLLYLIDGIRLNNSVFREGPNQYINTVDVFSIQKLELVKGPIAVLYGSDAIGGTLNMLSKGGDIKDIDAGCQSTSIYRNSSAEHSHMGRLEGQCVHNKISWFLGVSPKLFGNLKDGEQVLEKTGYRENDYDLKFGYHWSEKTKLILAHQNVDQKDIWRTHATEYGKVWNNTTVGTDKKRALDQQRKLTYLQWQTDAIKPIDLLKFSLSLQSQKEEQDRIKKDSKQEIQGFDVSTQGLMLSAQIDTLDLGLDYYLDKVSSFSDQYSDKGIFTSSAVQGPIADHADYSLMGIYAQNEVPVGENLNILVGFRYNEAKVKTDKFFNPKTQLQDKFSEEYSATAVSLRASNQMDESGNVRIFAGVSQGFRAPNLSDLTRLDSARTLEFEIPATDLKPEHYQTYELGIKWRDIHKMSGQAALYYTSINGMIIRTPTGEKKGTDTIVTKKNSGDGYNYGFEGENHYQITSNLESSLSYQWSWGELAGYPDSSSEARKEPMSRIMPFSANLSLKKWVFISDQIPELWSSLHAQFSRKQDRLSSGDQRDTQRIPPDGTPGFAVYHLRGGAKLYKSTQLSLAINNLFNKVYRIHGSGLNEAGRNFILSLEASI